MTLRQTMARHARTALTRLDHFGESVTRRRKNVADLAGLRVTIRRLGRRRWEEGVQVAFYRAEVFVPAGLDVQAADELLFPMVEGGESTPNRVDGLISSDANGSLWEVIR